jgi:hypothetical protein
MLPWWSSVILICVFCLGDLNRYIVAVQTNIDRSTFFDEYSRFFGYTIEVFINILGKVPGVDGWARTGFIHLENFEEKIRAGQSTVFEILGLDVGKVWPGFCLKKYSASLDSRDD